MRFTPLVSRPRPRPRLRRVRLTLALLAGPAAGAAQAPADSLLPLDPAAVTGTLPNRLRYYIQANRRPEHRAELRLVVNTGSVLEADDQRGLAHFVEHMAFNGTRNFAKQQLVDYIESIGMRFGPDLNASTSFDETIYELLVPTDSAGMLVKALQILEDWAHGVSFDTSEVRKERGVVVEEWRLGRGAGMRMLDRQLPVLFRGSRYAERLPIGTRECIEACPREAMTRFYRDWYRPDLMAVVAVGDFDARAVERQVREQFARVPARSGAPPRPAVPVPPRDSAAVAIATDPEATSTSVSVYFLHPPRPEGTVAAWRDAQVEALASSILNQRLYELTQRPNPPFIGAGAGRSPLVRSSDAFTLGAGVPDTGVRRGLDAVLVEIERAARHGFTAPELDRAKRELLRDYERAHAERDRTESAVFASAYVSHFLSGAPAPGVAQEYARAQALIPGIPLPELNRRAREWLGGSTPVVLVNAPEAARSRIPEPARLLALFAEVKGREIPPYAESVSDAPLVAGALERVRITVERRDTALGTTEWTLANGVRVILKPTDFKADQILFQSWMPGGTSRAPDSLVLSTRLASQLVAVSGVGNFSAVELQKKLAGAAVSLVPFISEFGQGLSGLASPRDLETLFQLAYLYVTAPRYDRDAVGAQLTNLRAALANRSASPQAAFQDTLQVTLASHHPRSAPITPARLGEIRPEAAVAFYRERFADATGMTFGIVGAFSPDSIRPLVQRYLGNLPAAAKPDRWANPGIRRPPGVVRRTVRKGIEPASRTALVFHGPFEYNRAERFALHTLGEVLQLRLREQLREELGGTYGADVSATPTRVPEARYDFLVTFGSDPGRADQLVDAVFAQVDTLHRTGPRGPDVQKVREALLRSRETNLKENGWWLAQLMGAVQSGESPAEAMALEPYLQGLTLESVREAARKYLDPARYVRVTLLPERREP